jgi:CheY-like chemotaxis protein
MSAIIPLRKLLVVDDEPLVRQTLSLCLRDEYDVTAVASGEEALLAVAAESYPVVLLDLCMEGLTGIETLKRLKKIRELQKVIILTAHESTESAIAAVNHGAFNYLLKPFERKHLKAVISRGFADYDQENLRTQEMQSRLMSVHDSFFSLLCHEFNTPLNIVLGFSELLAHEPQDSERASWIKEIQDSGRQLHDILMEIVDYVSASHLAEAGVRSDFLPEEVFLPLIEHSRERGIELEFHDFCPTGHRYLGPEKSVLMVARKLVRMATRGSTVARLSVQAANVGEGMELRLTVDRVNDGRDGGKAGRVDALFGVVESVGGGSGQNGLGLELATCRKIAEYANGTVDCQLGASGEMQFVARLPIDRA